MGSRPSKCADSTSKQYMACDLVHIGDAGVAGSVGAEEEDGVVLVVRGGVASRWVAGAMMLDIPIAQ